MKKVLTLIMAAALALSLAACSSSAESTAASEAAADSSLDDVIAAGKITCAISPDFAPSEFKDPNTGEVLGSDVFVANYIANYLSEKYGTTIELEIEEEAFSSCIAAVQAGSVDFSVNSYSATDERKETFYCSSPYGMTDSSSDSYQGLLVPADKADGYDEASDFSGLTIAVQNTSLQYNLVSAQLPSDVNIEFITNVNMGASMLAEGKVDALATTSETGSILCKNFEGMAMAAFHFDYTSTGSVALVEKENVALGDAISEAIEAMTNDPDVDWESVRAEYTDLANELGVTNE